jgi:predicted PurR-regulated permease PerM
VAVADTGAAPAATLRARLGAQLAGATRYLFPFLTSTLTVLAGLVLVIFLAIYIGAESELYHRGLMHLFPKRARNRAGEVLTEMAIVLRKWLVTQLIAMLVIGGVTTIGLLVLKVKAAFALGLIAGLLEFVPTVGPLLSAVPAVAMGFIDSPEKALTVAVLYWAIQFMENNLLIPTLMRGGLDLPPALTLVAQALMTLVFGFLGLMVAVPLTAAVMVPIKMLYVEGVVGDPIEVRDEDGSPKSAITAK